MRPLNKVYAYFGYIMVESQPNGIQGAILVSSHNLAGRGEGRYVVGEFTDNGSLIVNAGDVLQAIGAIVGKGATTVAIKGLSYVTSERSQQEAEKIVAAAGEVIIDPQLRSLTVRGNSIQPSAQEFDLLWYLAGNQGRVVSRRKLLRDVWGRTQPDYELSRGATNIATHISRIRKHLGGEYGDKETGLIRTIKGRKNETGGYIFLDRTYALA